MCGLGSDRSIDITFVCVCVCVLGIHYPPHTMRSAKVKVFFFSFAKWTLMSDNHPEMLRGIMCNGWMDG